MLRVAASFSDGFQNTGPTMRRSPSRSGTFRDPRVRSRPRRNAVRGTRRRGFGVGKVESGIQMEVAKVMGNSAEWMLYGKNPIKMDEKWMNWVIGGIAVLGNLQIWMEHRWVNLQFLAKSWENGKIKHQIWQQQGWHFTNIWEFSAQHGDCTKSNLNRDLQQRSAKYTKTITKACAQNYLALFSL